MVTVCGAVSRDVRVSPQPAAGSQKRGVAVGETVLPCVIRGSGCPAVKRKTMPGLAATMGTARALTSGSPGLPNCVQTHH